jgi:hypothetical protein
MPDELRDQAKMSYSEVRSALGRCAAFESHQEGVGKSPSYVLNVRPHRKGHGPFTLTGPDLRQLLRDALTRLTPA